MFEIVNRELVSAQIVALAVGAKLLVVAAHRDPVVLVVSSDNELLFGSAKPEHADFIT